MPANPPEPAPDAEKPVAGQQQRKAGHPKTFADLAVGDVVLFSPSFSQQDRPATVERITPTQFVVVGVKFNRQSGYAVGQHQWNNPHVYLATEDEIKKARDAIHRSNLIYKAKSFQGWSALSNETLEAVLKLIQP